MEKNQNNKPQKTTPAISAIVAAVCIVIYLCALVQGAVRIYLSIDKNRITAEQEFSHIASLALSAGIQGFMDQKFIDSINNALSSSKNIKALIITGPDGEYAFEKQRGQTITWVNNSPRFINKSGFSNQTYSRPLPIQNLRNANIKGITGVFDYNEFSKILRETLLIILIGFSVAFSTMLLQLLLGKQENISSYTRKSPAHAFDEEEMQLPAVGPKGLFSPRCNIGWEEYIKDRLDAELHRCSSTEKDLAFILIEFNDLTNDSMFRQSAEETVSSFSSRDLVFEYGQWGIAVILPGIGLDAAISKSEKYYQHIMGKFPRGYNKSSSVCIGLTSRSGRLLNAGRIMLEAGEAVKKAKEDPKSPIIAFKSDPEKYREFISKN
jgi:GGDEF domain-containing protein